MISTYHVIDKLLDSVVIANVNLVQEDGEIDVVPHIVVSLDMFVKAIGPSFKLMAGYAADETNVLFVLLSSVLKERKMFRNSDLIKFEDTCSTCFINSLCLAVLSIVHKVKLVSLNALS